MNLLKYLALLSVLSLACSKKHLTSFSSDQKGRVDSMEVMSSIHDFQQELNEEYINPQESPLNENQLSIFKKSGGHDYFKIDLLYRVEAHLERSNKTENIPFKTTSERIAIYDLYGIATFYIKGREYKVNIYQNQKLKTSKEYKDHLFLPFYDLTNGDKTYGGGRYIDLTIPIGGAITIDFNKAYNPYCAYSTKYSCPITPRENTLNLEILAGVKYSNKH